MMLPAFLLQIKCIEKASSRLGPDFKTNLKTNLELQKLMPIRNHNSQR